nr:iq domain-containing protein iqm3 [Quercus suber]
MALSVDCHDHNPESMSMDSQKSKEIFVSTAAVGKGLYQDAKAQKLAFQHWIEAVGKGLYQDAKAQKLAFQHWIEAIDPRHRYGHNLNFYYEEWGKGDTEQPFFHWLDVGDGKDVDLKDCPRSRLRQECIKYLGLQEREYYEYIIAEGMIVHKQTGSLLDTSQKLQGSKWIFVMSTSKKLYAGEKRKGSFHHSSFLAGGATLAAGRLEAESGKLKLGEGGSILLVVNTLNPFIWYQRKCTVSAYSGHYRPTAENLGSFLAFLDENGVNLDKVQVFSPTEDHESYNSCKSVNEGSYSTKNVQEESKLGELTNSEPPCQAPRENEINSRPSESCTYAQTKSTRTHSYKRTLSSDLQRTRTSLPKKEILQRIKSKKEVSSYQLGHQLSLKWSTGAGPRIGCVADYPLKLRLQALEFVNLSPRDPPTPSVFDVFLSSITTLCVVM